MLYEVMRHVRNFFAIGGTSGTYAITDGYIDLSFLQSGQYFLIEGSVFNDGVYQYTEDLKLVDETFKGTITALAPHKEFLALVSEIEEYVKAHPDAGYISESFGGYSYTKATNAAGMPATWKDVFKTRLNAWRKL